MTVFQCFRLFIHHLNSLSFILINLFHTCCVDVCRSHSFHSFTHFVHQRYLGILFRSFVRKNSMSIFIKYMQHNTKQSNSDTDSPAIERFSRGDKSCDATNQKSEHAYKNVDVLRFTYFVCCHIIFVCCRFNNSIALQLFLFAHLFRCYPVEFYGENSQLFRHFKAIKSDIFRVIVPLFQLPFNSFFFVAIFFCFFPSIILCQWQSK